MRTRVSKLSFRPPLPRRAIVWFPTFDPAHAARITRFRAEHDPMHALLAPHVSLVFPFYANLTVAQIESHIKRCTRGWPVVPVTFHGTDPVASEFAVLMAELRRDALTEMHDRLYRGPLAIFLRKDIEYRPHITLGRIRPGVPLDTLMADAELIFRDSYNATLRELSIITLNDDGTIVVSKTVPLLL